MIKSNKISLQSTILFPLSISCLPHHKETEKEKERERKGWRLQGGLAAFELPCSLRFLRARLCILDRTFWTGWMRKPRDGTRRARKRSAPRAVTLAARARVHVSWAYLHTVVAQCGRYVYEMHVRCRPRPVSFFLNSVNVYTPGGRRCL